ncbi:bcl-2-related protein A1 isoform X3 [Rousettus aegyptiacus]|uniref:bcl-2-related protein A1 isoform X3 n=1 Tax=Rousettus aegyptiacus TaxID=9407 RepID=UPI00168D51C4|nr:bcl-2-related protein A1 isoform X3 [Rousettus aegyptiacus]
MNTRSKTNSEIGHFPRCLANPRTRWRGNEVLEWRTPTWTPRAPTWCRTLTAPLGRHHPQSLPGSHAGPELREDGAGGEQLSINPDAKNQAFHTRTENASEAVSPGMPGCVLFPAPASSTGCGASSPLCRNCHVPALLGTLPGRRPAGCAETLRLSFRGAARLSRRLQHTAVHPRQMGIPATPRLCTRDQKLN